MNNIIIKKGIFGLVILAGLAFSGTAQAAAQFATQSGAYPSDYPLVQVKRCPKNQTCDASGYSTSLSGVQPGDRIWVMLYYRNVGDTAATNTKFTLSPQSTGTVSGQTFSATLRADNASQVSGSATVSLSQAQTITFSSLKMYDQNGLHLVSPLPDSQTNIFGGGFNMGTVESRNVCPSTNTFCKQGVLVATYIVGETATSQCSAWITTSPSSVASGNSSTVSWGTTGCTSATVSGPGVSSNSLSGSQSTGSLYSTSTYTINAWSSNGSDSNTATVSVNQNQSQCNVSLYASPSRVQSGSSSTLFYTVDNCTSATLSGTNLGTINLPNGNGSRNTGILYGSNTYTYSIYGSNGNSSDNDDTTVRVNQDTWEESCSISSFYASPTTVTSGSSSTLYWNTTGVSSVYISGLNYSSTYGSSGSQTTGAIYGSGNYTMTAYCQNGGTKTRTVSVSVNQPQANLSVVTGAPTLVGVTSARLNGVLAQSGGYNTNVYFEWGSTTALGFTTASLNAGSGSGATFFDSLTSLQPSTTYWYRAVATNAYGTARGELQSFTTNARPVVINNPPRTIIVREPAQTIVTSGIGTGSNLVSLSIQNREANLCVDDIVDYTVTYKNISGVTLNNVVLQVLLPQDVEFRSANPGIYNVADHTVTLNVGTLVQDQEGVMYVSGRVLRSAIDRDLITGTATIAFTNPTNNSQESAIAYALNNTTNCARNSLAGLALFGNGFWPTTLIGWLVLILIFLALIYLATRVYHGARKDAYRTSAPRYDDMDVPTYNSH